MADGDMLTALAARDRKACGALAPAQGLYLAEVDYDQRPISDTEADGEP